MFKKIIEILNYSNTFISVAAAFLTYGLSIQIGGNDAFFYSVFVFFSTLATYNFQRFLRVDELIDYESDFLNNTAAEPEKPAQESTAEPSSNIENFDSNADYQHLDLLQYLDDSHILKRVSQLLHEQTYIPSSSLLMVGLGVVSAYTALSNVVVYRDGKPMPIGLYVVVEQPSGTSKSLSLNTFSYKPSLWSL